MKKTTPAGWTDNSPVPPVKHIPKPDFPQRSGVAATGTAILIFVALFCIFQYWLLTATLEAYHAGDEDLPFGAFLASLGCFILAAGLTIAGEVALLKQQEFLRKNQGTPKPKTIETPVNRPGYSGAPSPSDYVRQRSGEAGGGDAG